MRPLDGVANYNKMLVSTYFLTFLLYIYRVTRSLKESSERPHAPSYLPMDLSYGVTVQYQIKTLAFVQSVCIVTCHFIRCIDSRSHHHSHHIELFHTPRDLPCVIYCPRPHRAHAPFLTNTVYF